ncbi:hypothetical protein ACHAXA_010001 [Cyclostephanos tholiformis]|uniref:Uncharacterized protein n=1 Tax=Cyclostephanos tholiformis TaxID=382380 RepID=A0ABD3RQV2_9STRA
MAITPTAPAGGASSASATASAAIRALHERLDGPTGVVRYLVPRLWMDAGDDDGGAVRGDDALTMLSFLVECRTDEYMALAASHVRRDVERVLATASASAAVVVVGTDQVDDDADDGRERTVTDALLLALSKLLVGANSDDQVAVATDAHASLLGLCRYDRDTCHHRIGIANRTLSALDAMWSHLRRLDKVERRKSSTSQMRIATLMIDICLLGGEEMSCALSCGITDELLHVALDVPNDDPLLQLSALDQLERLTVHSDLNAARADFLLCHDVLRRGLLCLVGSRGDLSRDANEIDEWEDMDPINGGAALRLLSEICRVGVMSCASVTSEGTWDKFQLLLRSFQRALHNIHPRGELERLSYIHAVSSLVGSCASVASSKSPAATGVASAILGDTTLLHGWLSLHGRVSQPKLKSTVLCSLSQVMEPSMWQQDSAKQLQSDNTTRPTDSIVLQLYRAFGHANNERDSTELILASAKSPFIEERLGAYDILRALVMRSAGLRLLLLYDDGTDKCSGGSSFLEWLLNKDLEYTVEGRRAKYHIAETMLSCNANIISGLLPPRALRQVEDWIRHGPNFVTAVSWEMATE